MNRPTLIFDAETYFTRLILAVDSARETVLVETYIYRFDSIGVRVAEALIRAAQRGVDVRLVVDGFGTPFWRGGWVDRLEEAGVKTLVFHPLPWQLWRWGRKALHAPPLRRLFRSFIEANHRDHRKLTVVDGEKAWVSSMNITEDHTGLHDRGIPWRDTAVEITTPSKVDYVQRLALQNWGEPGPGAFDHPMVHSNETLGKRLKHHRDLVQRIHEARRRIWITTPYFVPSGSLIRAVKKAAQSEVDVRLLLPLKSDMPIVRWASAGFYQSLLESGVKIYEYRKSVLHAKHILIDDWAILGSSNLNQRSVRHDLEIDVVLTSPTNTGKLEHQFEIDIKDSIEFSVTTWYRFNWSRAWLGRIILLLRYWL